MIEHLPPGGSLIAQSSPDAVEIAAGRSEAWQRFRSNRSAFSGLVVLGLLVVTAVLAPLLAQHDPYQIPPGRPLLSPNASHWFGTDQLGRDVFARVVFGARTSLVVGLGAALLASVIGTAVGAVAGFRGGWTDLVLMRVAEVFLVLPAVLLAAAFVVALGRDELTLIVVLGVVGWPMTARIARSSVLEAKQPAFVDAARAAGVSEARVLWRHVLPHAMPAVLVVSVLSVGTAILAESALSFLAIGITEPTPSWGLMISGAGAYLGTAPHAVLFPAGAIFVTVLSLVAISDGVRDALGVDRT